MRAGPETLPNPLESVVIPRRRPHPLPATQTAGARARLVARPAASRRSPSRLALLAPVLAPVLALLLGACGSEPPAGKSILVITMDTTRADHLGSYGSPMDLTPNVDALAARGVLFEQVHAPMPQTLPSHATMFTGLPPRQHLALENTYQLDSRFRTLAELVQERGYATGAFIGALVLDDETGIQQGFEHYDIPGGAWNENREGHPPQRTAEEVTQAALRWSETLDPDRPFLMWAHYYDPHGDQRGGFQPPARHRKQINMKEIRERVRNSGKFPPELDTPAGRADLAEFWAGYAAEVRYTDEQIGRLLEGLEEQGLMEDTIVVVTGDHGEGLYEHGIKAHGVYVWEEMHRVPLILTHPGGLKAGSRVDGPVFLQDLLPTLERMALDEEPVQGGGDLGMDLWAPVMAGDSLPSRPVFLERPHFDEDRVRRRLNGVDIPKNAAYGFLTAVIQEDMKLIRHPDGTLLLFDLRSDPGEQLDLADDPDHEQLRDRLAGLLDAWMSQNKVGLPGEDIQISPERWETLRKLGYVGGEDGH
jgi:arylsulfatase A-like enzyme